VGSWITMLEMVHEYARERLAERAGQDVLRDRHARYYMALAERFGPLSGAPTAEGPPARLEQERNNLRAALQWALQCQDQELVLRLGAALWLFWEVQGDYAEGHRWLEAAVRTPPADQAGLAGPWIQVLMGAGVLAGEMGDFSLAVSRLEESLALCREAGNERQISTVLVWLAWAAGEMGDYERAIAAYEECLGKEERRADGPRLGMKGFILNGLGNVAQYREDFAVARAYLEESLAIRRRAGDSYGVMCTLHNLASVAEHLGEYEQAAAPLHESLELAWELRSEEHIAWNLLGMADVFRARGRPAQAARLLGRAERLFRSLGTVFGEANRQTHEQTIARARAALPEEEFAALWAAGAALPLEQAVEEGLGEYDSGTSEDGKMAR